MMGVVIFSIILCILLYTFIGYGVFMWGISLVKRNPVHKQSFLPFISMVVIAYNEEQSIIRRIKNLINLDYPSSLCEVIVISDGSTDKTAEYVTSMSSEAITLFEMPYRQGKSACINYAIPLCQGEIVVFADARQEFDAHVLKELADNFYDAKVGAVSGELVFRTKEGTLVGQGIDFYWRYEKWLRKSESRIDSTVGATGAIYAIRKSLFSPLPKGVLLDDVVIPMRIVLEGYRCVFEPKAMAYDDVAQYQKEEERRKVRTIAGNFQLFSLMPEVFLPFKNRIFFQTLSHKLLRLTAPFFLILFFFVNIFLVRHIFFTCVCIMQILFYLLAGMGYILKSKKIPMKLCAIPYAFVMLNMCTMQALWQIMRYDPQGIWQVKKPSFPDIKKE